MRTPDWLVGWLKTKATLTKRVINKQILITRMTWQDSCQTRLVGGKHTHVITQNMKGKTDGQN